MPDSLYAPALRRPLSQGDILEKVRVGEPHIGTKEKPFTVMALSHGCEIDKPSAKVFLVAEVRPLKDFSPQNHAGIRNGETLALFHLPAEGPHGERCVDLRKTFRVSFDSIGATGFERIGGEDQRVFPAADPRLQSLSDYGVKVLQGRIVGFYTRSRDLEPPRSP